MYQNNWLGYLLIFCFIGSIVAINAIVSIGVLLVLFLVLYSLYNPVSNTMLMLVMSCISFQYFIKVDFFGVDAVTAYKLLFLISIIILVITKNKVNYSFSYPIIIISFICIYSTMVVFYRGEFPLFVVFKAYIGLFLPFLILMIKWESKSIEKILFILSILPIISSIVGVTLDLLGIRDVFMYEYTGTKRFQGANVPAHLAELCFIAIAVLVYQYIRKPRNFYLLLIAINFGIVVLTYTRTFMMACSILVGVVLLYFLINFLKGKVIYVITLTLALVALMIMIYFSLDNLMQRTFSYNGNFDTSGREYAWTYFLKEAADTKLLGRGLGIAQLLNPPVYGFVAPHNEYLRFYLETGIIGCILFFSAVVYIFKLVYEKIAKENTFIFKVYFISFVVGFAFLSYYDNTLTNIQSMYPFIFFISAIVSIESEKALVK